MKKLYIIILGPETDKDLLSTRIKELGDSYAFWDRHFLLSSEITSSTNLYNRLVGDDGDKQIVVFALNDNPEYWGYANKGLWTWLKER